MSLSDPVPLLPRRDRGRESGIVYLAHPQGWRHLQLLRRERHRRRRQGPSQPVLAGGESEVRRDSNGFRCGDAGRKTAIYPDGELIVAGRVNQPGKLQMVLEGTFLGKKYAEELGVEVKSGGELAAQGWAEIAVSELLAQRSETRWLDYGLLPAVRYWQQSSVVPGPGKRERLQTPESGR